MSNSYYEHLAPLTPVTHPDLRNLEANPNVLSEEPMLTITILTIASRYVQLEGPGGRTRALYAHEELWKYLRGMTTRMFWAQEQFGGGFCGAGAKTQSTKLGEKGKLRTLGSIERLLHHPLSVHISC